MYLLTDIKFYDMHYSHIIDNCNNKIDDKNSEEYHGEYFLYDISSKKDTKVNGLVFRKLLWENDIFGVEVINNFYVCPVITPRAYELLGLVGDFIDSIHAVPELMLKYVDSISNEYLAGAFDGTSLSMVYSDDYLRDYDICFPCFSSFKYGMLLPKQRHISRIYGASITPIKCDWLTNIVDFILTKPSLVKTCGKDRMMLPYREFASGNLKCLVVECSSKLLLEVL